MPQPKGQVRRSQIITTYGVGAIIAVEDESFMVAGIDRWPVRRPDLQEPRLERILGVSGFATPPATEDQGDIPVVRFPRTVYCPKCKRLAAHSFFTAPTSNACGTCRVPLVPSRFVVCCPKGHIDDFPYYAWVHAKKRFNKGEKHDLRIESGGTTASLRDIIVSCSCGARRTLEGAFDKFALREIYKCRGKRPWLTGDDEDCDESPRTLQRGASNVWFSVTKSAISIPPWSEGALKILNRNWNVLRSIPDEALAPTIQAMGLADGTSYSVDDLVRAVGKRKAQEQGGHGTQPTLRSEEYEALCLGKEEASKDQDFVCIPAERIPETLSRWFDRVMLVKRLREIRALHTFARLNPPAGVPSGEGPALYNASPGWLPGIEVKGEGVFLRIAENVLSDWEARPEVAERIARIDANYRKRFESLEMEPDRTVTPRLVLIHTLAHAMILQWSLESGYPASALRERLYVSPEMAGFLIYTATSDSAGSLGGVVAQADPERLEAGFKEGMSNVAWCSADPLCIEADAGGVDSLNLAACHACVLLPEVSCEEMNLLLDRAVLIGTPEAPTTGLFNSVLSQEP